MLIFAVLDLAGVAAYEVYMHTIWEKTVHAPIRLDIFAVELPFLVLGIVLGIVGAYRTTSSRAVPLFHCKHIWPLNDDRP